MAKIFNETRKVKGRTITKVIDFYGKRWAIEDGADGYAIVDVRSPQLPQTVAEFIEGNETTLSAPISSNVNKIGHYALAQFPAVKDVYLFKTSGVVTLLSDSFGGLNSLENIYVPSDLLATYRSTYSSMSYVNKFTGLRSDYEWTIPFVAGQTVLTETIMNNYIGMLSNGQKNAITLIHIPSGYTSFELGATKHLLDMTFANLTTVDCQNEMLFLGQAKTVTKTGAILEVR